MRGLLTVRPYVLKRILEGKRAHLPMRHQEGAVSQAPESLQMVTIATKLNMLTPGKESYDQPRQHVKNQRHYFANKGQSSHGYGFSSGHVWM